MKFLFFITISIVVTFVTAYFIKDFVLFCWANIFYAMVLGGIARLKIPKPYVDNIFYYMACSIPIVFIGTLMVGFDVINF